MELDLKRILHDLEGEKEAIDETIAALERLLARQDRASRKRPPETLQSGKPIKAVPSKK